MKKFSARGIPYEQGFGFNQLFEDISSFFENLQLKLPHRFGIFQEFLNILNAFQSAECLKSQRSRKYQGHPCKIHASSLDDFTLHFKS